MLPGQFRCQLIGLLHRRTKDQAMQFGTRIAIVFRLLQNIVHALRTGQMLNGLNFFFMMAGGILIAGNCFIDLGIGKLIIADAHIMKRTQHVGL